LRYLCLIKADKNHDGLLDADELQATFKKRFDAQTTVGQMNGLIAKFDQDNKGRLNEEEYRNMLTSLEEQDTDHTKKQMKSILEGLPDGGNVRSNQIAPATEMI
jgi:Ca2+-binding EF-hand superfamily protein